MSLRNYPCKNIIIGLQQLASLKRFESHSSYYNNKKTTIIKMYNIESDNDFANKKHNRLILAVWNLNAESFRQYNSCNAVGDMTITDLVLSILEIMHHFVYYSIFPVLAFHTINDGWIHSSSQTLVAWNSTHKAIVFSV